MQGELNRRAGRHAHAWLPCTRAALRAKRTYAPPLTSLPSACSRATLRRAALRRPPAELSISARSLATSFWALGNMGHPLSREQLDKIGGEPWSAS